jgi:hypothetical protein
VPLVFFVALTLMGVVVGGGGGGSAWTAAVLVGEPCWTIATLFTMHLLLTRRRRAAAWAVGLGSTVALFAMRATPLPEPPQIRPPSWSQRVSRCAAALPPPTDNVRVLQWTSPPDLDAVAGAMVTVEPDVTVIFGVDDPAASDELLARFGGEVQRLGDALVHVRGVFHLCGDDAAWVQGEARAWPTAVAFVGVPGGTVFPLVVGRLPAWGAVADWGTRWGEAAERLTAVAGAAVVDGAVVVADAGAPWTFRHLDGALVAAGLRRVVVPPSWPARVGGLPALPLHPYDRVWTGAGWRVAESRAVPMEGTGGERVGVVTTLVGVGE